MDLAIPILMTVAVMAVILAFIRMIAPGIPDINEWAPLANVSDPYQIEAYKQAAKKLGVDIILAYPTPAPAGADVCAEMGMKGVWLRRSQASKESELIHEMFNAYSRITWGRRQ